MIDYEKLKQAHELAAQCKSHYLVHIISHKDFDLTLVNWLPDMPDLNFKDFDSLIDKLIELTEQNPKYKEGQTVWVAYDEPKEFTIKSCTGKKYFLDEVSGKSWMGLVTESEIYPSREALVEAQIKYWQSMRPIECSEAIRKHHELEDDESLPHMSVTLNDGRKFKSTAFAITGGGGGDSGGAALPPSVCQHVPYTTLPTMGDGMSVSKCRKCGEFYR